MKTSPISEIIEKTTPPGWLCEGFIRHRSLSLLAAEPYSGKTLLCLYIVLCLDLGRDILGRFHVPTPRKTLIVCSDSPAWDVGIQLRCLARGLGLNDSDMGVLTSLLYQGPPLRITKPETYRELKDFINSEHIDFCIFDTWLSVHGQDENSNQLMNLANDLLKQLRDETHCGFLLTTHLSKPALQPRSRLANIRGATAQVGGVDQAFTMARTSRGLRLYMDKGRGHRGGIWDVPLKIKELESTHPEGAVTFEIQDAVDPASIVLSCLPETRAGIKVKLLESLPKDQHQNPKLVDNTLNWLKKQGKVRLEDGIWQVNTL